jgi:histidyl-tRNA synthetase
MLGTVDALQVTQEVREIGLRAERAYGSRSPRKQFAAAARSGARFAVVLGADEMARGKVGVKNLRSDGEQIEVSREEVAPWLLTQMGERPR